MNLRVTILYSLLLALLTGCQTINVTPESRPLDQAHPFTLTKQLAPVVVPTPSMTITKSNGLVYLHAFNIPATAFCTLSASSLPGGPYVPILDFGCGPLVVSNEFGNCSNIAQQTFYKLKVTTWP